MVHKRIPFAACVLALVAFESAAGGPLRATGRQSPEFQQTLEALYNRLIAMKNWNPSDDLKLKKEIQGLTETYILTRLNEKTPPRAADLEKDLNETFSQAIGHMSAANLRKFWGEVHYASVLKSKALGNIYVVGFMIPHGNTSLDVVEVAQRVSNTYRITARAGTEMKDHTLALSPLRSPHTATLRFLAYGDRLGGNQSPLGVVLYEFGGKSLMPLWTRDNLWEGKVMVEVDTVTLTFRDAAHYEKGTPPYFMKEEYGQTQRGLKLLARHWTDAP